MKMLVPQYVVEKFLTEHPTPFFKENGTLYMKFDSIKISNHFNADGVRIEYTWKGESLAFLDVSGINFCNNDTLNLMSIEGRQQVDVGE